MTIGLTTFLLLLAAVPGFVFRRFYYVGEFHRQYNPRKLIFAWFWSTIIGIPLLACTVLAYNNLGDSIINAISINESRVYYLLEIIFNNSGKKSDEIGGIINNVVNKLYSPTFLKSFIIFLLILLVQSAIVGRIISYLIIYLQLDARIPFLRFENYWFYYLRGHFLKFPQFPGKHYKRKGVNLDILVRLNESTTRLYMGMLAKYELKRGSNTLDLLVLTDVARYSEGRELKAVPTDAFIIPYDRVININIRLLERLSEWGIKGIARVLKPLVLFISILLPFLIAPEYFFQDIIRIEYGIAFGIAFAATLQTIGHVINLMTKGGYKITCGAIKSAKKRVIYPYLSMLLVLLLIISASWLVLYVIMLIKNIF